MSDRLDSGRDRQVLAIKPAAVVAERRRGVEPTRAPVLNGLRLREDLPFEEWVAVGTRLAELSRASAWCLGDWLHYGERVYGRRYKTALAITCFDYQTLRNYAWVAGRFAPDRRHPTLSFQHHAEVAALSEAAQDLWLNRADQRQWSRNELRRQLRSALPAARRGEEPSVVLQIQVPAGREHRWREAAEAASQELMEWLAQAADDAAERALPASAVEIRVAR